MYIYGKNVALEALKNNDKINKVYLNKDFHDNEIIDLISKKGLLTKISDKRGLDNIVKGSHQGIILEVPNFKYSSLDEFTSDNSLIIILDHLEDPHNFGAIIRTCEAAGVNAIIIPKDRSVEVNSTVIKVSAGAISNMPIVQVTNINNTIKELKKEGFWIIGTDMKGTPYNEIDYKGKTAIVIGNEGNGLSRLTEESCDFIASIPMQGTINSLNASVATGIVVFEALKNRK